MNEIERSIFLFAHSRSFDLLFRDKNLIYNENTLALRLASQILCDKWH